MRNGLVGLWALTFCGAVAFAGGSAQAQWDVCNETGHEIVVAIGYKQDGEWISEGWWKVESGGSCATVIAEPLWTRYLYLRAEHAIGGAWEDEYFFCTSPNAFTIHGDQNCEGRGYEREGFVEVDTGTSATSWRTNLTD